MWRRWGLIVLAVLAAEPVKAADPAPPIVAVVDLQKVVHESEAGKSIDLQYDKQHELFGDRVSRQESALDTQEQELTRQRTVLTADAFSTQRETLEAHSAEVQKAIQQESQANQQAFNDAFAQLVTSTREIIGAVAKEKGVAVVLPAEQALYLGEGAVDITDTVMGRLNAKLTAIKVTLPPAPPGANFVPVQPAAPAKP